MTISKVKDFVISLLFVSIFGWMLYYIFSYDNYYNGEALHNLKVVIKDKPKLHFDHESSSFYYFTTNEYKNEFRIEGGGFDLVYKDEKITGEIESIKYGDTIEIQIRKTDTTKLLTQDKKIEVIGLSFQDKLIIEPAIVERNDANNKKDRIFSYCVMILIIVMFILIKYRKHKRIE